MHDKINHFFIIFINWKICYKCIVLKSINHIFYLEMSYRKARYSLTETTKNNKFLKKTLEISHQLENFEAHL
jgi:hypothetical protein